uniref:C-type lectin domain-containing protein n=1 Tax=Oreochromis niloticus TaxID=8128 RepID=A0A669F4W5_ORENI
MEGRFVNVFLPGQKKTLTLCEVEVYAAPAVEPLSNVALKKPTVQSSTSSPHFSSKAVDGYKNGSFYGAGFSHTLEETNPWWRVDLLAVYKVNAVTIINRQDCCSERILGVEIRIGDSLDQNGNQNPRSLSGDDWFWMSGHSMNFFNWPQDFVPYYYSSTCGAMSNGEHFLWQDLHCGEHLNFICQSGAGDNVQRVDFYSTKNVTTVK